ncbi:MAG TPA: cupin domain-containing protein [Gaiellaceae bacterium]|nr:cupin domain-containing protein [Gaiellaceae bacterium]
MPGHAVSERDLRPARVEGDTAERAVAIDASFGSEILELHLARYEPGRSRPRTLNGVQEVMYAAAGRATLVVDGKPHELEPGTAAYLVSGESYEVDNPGPETLLLVSAVAPQDSGPELDGRRIVRYDDQPVLTASGDREFRYLVTHEAGCNDLTQFYGIIAPGRAPEHSHVYDEVIYVLEGEGMLHIGDSHEPVSQGTCIHLPPLLGHSLENSGDSPMRIVAVFHPAGDPASRAYEANE